MFEIIRAKLKSQLEIRLRECPRLAAAGRASIYGKCVGQKDC